MSEENQIAETKSPKKTAKDKAKEKAKEYSEKFDKYPLDDEASEYGKKIIEHLLKIYRKEIFLAGFAIKECLCSTNILILRLLIEVSKYFTAFFLVYNINHDQDCVLHKLLKIILNICPPI